jgi:hypothetical protein
MAVKAFHGPLRAERSLRDAYTGFALGLPMVGGEIFDCDQRERQPKGYTSHEVTAARAGHTKATKKGGSFPTAKIHHAKNHDYHASHHVQHHKKLQKTTHPQTVTRRPDPFTPADFFSAARTTGSSTATAAPCGCRLNALISPPCSCTIE